MKNPLLLTARQRALLDKRSGDDSLESCPAEPLVALPSGKAGCMGRWRSWAVQKTGCGMLKQRGCHLEVLTVVGCGMVGARLLYS